MHVQWPKLLFKASFWLCTEIALTFLGLDDLADYGEFIFQHRACPQSQSNQICLIVSV